MYQTVNHTTEEGFAKLERLVARGWEIIEYSIISATLQKKATPKKKSAVTKENIGGADISTLKNSPALKNLDLEIDYIRELDPKKPHEKVLIDSGKGYKYILSVGYPKSMGERGYGEEWFYEEYPTEQEIYNDTVQTYQEFIRDLAGGLKNHYEELAYKKIQKILNKLKVKYVKSESLHALGSMVNMGGFDNAENPLDEDVQMCDKCFEPNSKLFPCRCNQKIERICHECWTKSGMPPILNEKMLRESALQQVEQDLLKMGITNYKVDGATSKGVSVTIPLPRNYKMELNVDWY
jgi:hypothetical protein